MPKGASHDRLRPGMTQYSVIFDLDGTLIESEQIWRDVRHNFTIEHGGRWRDDAQKKMMGMRTQEWARYMHEELGVALPPDEIAEQVVDIVRKRMQDDVPLLPGATAALERLASQFRLGVATSAALAVAKTVLRETAWEKFFSVVVSADEVAHGKPAPDVYLRAIDIMKAEPKSTAAVEDSGSGIRSAHAAGLAVVAIPNHDFPPDKDALSLAARILKDLNELDAGTIDDVLSNVDGG